MSDSLINKSEGAQHAAAESIDRSAYLVRDPHK
jgi:FHS family L-fucose permease-like MFS transporter